MTNSYSEGTLVRGPDSQVYLISNQQLLLLQDTSDNSTAHRSTDHTIDTEGLEMLPELSAELLDTIPLGMAMDLVLTASRQDEVKSNMRRRYMDSTVTLSRAVGRIDVTTRVWTRQPWIGFTGGVIVILGDAAGQRLWNSSLHQFGVDGFRVPFKQSDRIAYWVEAVPRDVAFQATVIEIVHSHAPRDRLMQTLDDLVKVGQRIGEIANVLRNL